MESEVKKLQKLSLSMRPQAVSRSKAYVIGDLHGNPYSLLRQLIDCNVITISFPHLEKLRVITQSTYIDQFYAARQRGDKFLANFLEKIVIEEIQIFERILERLSIIKPEALILLIGDELADRGYCDLFMLLTLFALKKKGIDIFSLLSNHALEFLYAFLLNHWNPNDTSYMLGIAPNSVPPEMRSLTNLRILLDENLFPWNKLEPLIHSWLDSLHLITYSYCNEEKNKQFTLYSHAPIGLETVEALANEINIHRDLSKIENLTHTIDEIDRNFRSALKYNPLVDIKKLCQEYHVACNDQTPDSLYKTIEDIENGIFSAKEKYQHLENDFKIIQNNQLTLNKIFDSFLYKLLQGRYYKIEILAKEEKDLHSSLLATVWNRQRNYLRCPARIYDVDCFFCSGHESPCPAEDFYKNKFELDNKFGKSSNPTLVYYDNLKLIDFKFKYISNTNRDDNDQKNIQGFLCLFYSETASILLEQNNENCSFAIEQFVPVKKVSLHYFQEYIPLDSPISANELDNQRKEDIINNATKNVQNQRGVFTILSQDDGDNFEYLEIAHEIFSSLLKQTFLTPTHNSHTASCSQTSVSLPPILQKATSPYIKLFSDNPKHAASSEKFSFSGDIPLHPIKEFS